MDLEQLHTELSADPFREDYPLAMLAEDVAHEQDPQRRAALSARMLERCEGAQFSVARVDGGVWLWVELGDQRILVAMPSGAALQVSIMLLKAMSDDGPQPPAHGSIAARVERRGE